MKTTSASALKICLTIITLSACAVLSASAGGPLSSAREQPQPARTVKHSIFPRLLPQEIYQIDDGTAENDVGFTLGGDLICLNEFPTVNQPITSINVAWGWSGDSGPSVNGLPYTVVLWDDPNGDGLADDATVLATASDVVANAGTDTFIKTPIPATTVTTANFFVGFIIHHESGQYPSGFDQTAPLPNRSFVAGGTSGGDINDLTNNELPVAPIEEFGLYGNWMIRADAGTFGFITAFSEKNGWAIELSRDGRGVEDRSGGPDHEYSLYFTFTTPLASLGNASTTCGSVTSFGIDPTDPTRANVELTGVDCNASYITVSLSDVADTNGNTLPSAATTFGLLIGDVTGDGAVTLSDVRQVKSQMGDRVNKYNFRGDVSGHTVGIGRIDRSDLKLVKQQAGTELP